MLRMVPTLIDHHAAKTTVGGQLALTTIRGTSCSLLVPRQASSQFALLGSFEVTEREAVL